MLTHHMTSLRGESVKSLNGANLCDSLLRPAGKYSNHSESFGASLAAWQMLWQRPHAGRDAVLS